MVRPQSNRAHTRITELPWMVPTYMCHPTSLPVLPSLPSPSTLATHHPTLNILHLPSYIQHTTYSIVRLPSYTYHLTHTILHVPSYTYIPTYTIPQYMRSITPYPQLPCSDSMHPTLARAHPILGCAQSSLHTHMCIHPTFACMTSVSTF